MVRFNWGIPYEMDEGEVREWETFLADAVARVAGAVDIDQYVKEKAAGPGRKRDKGLYGEGREEQLLQLLDREIQQYRPHDDAEEDAAEKTYEEAVREAEQAAREAYQAVWARHREIFRRRNTGVRLQEVVDQAVEEAKRLRGVRYESLLAEAREADVVRQANEVREAFRAAGLLPFDRARIGNDVRQRAWRCDFGGTECPVSGDVQVYRGDGEAYVCEVTLLARGGVDRQPSAVVVFTGKASTRRQAYDAAIKGMVEGGWIKAQ